MPIDTQKKSRSEMYLGIFLGMSPLSHALWRTVEAVEFDKVKLNKPVLDLGCGFGEFAGVVFGKIECGIDINSNDLKTALRNRNYGEVLLADARKLPFKKSTFETVVSVSVMEHIERADVVVKEVARVLKKGGIFAFTVPTTKMYKNLLGVRFFNSVGLSALARAYAFLHKKLFAHVNIRTVDWWEKKLADAGFELTKKKGTISLRLLMCHEVFLLTALPSQLGRWLTGKRWIWGKWRSTLLPKYFVAVCEQDSKCEVNMFFLARKK